jgi:hypothetical protein
LKTVGLPHCPQAYNIERMRDIIRQQIVDESSQGKSQIKSKSVNPKNLGLVDDGKCSM